MGGHGAVRAEGAGCHRHQSFAQSCQVDHVWQCSAIEPGQTVAQQSTSRRHAPRPSAPHSGSPTARSPWGGHGVVRAEGAAGCQRHQSLAQSYQVYHSWQCPAIEPGQTVAQSTSRRHAPRPSAPHGGGARASLRGQNGQLFNFAPRMV